MHARIIGTGGYLPEKVLTNHDLARMVDTSDDWIVTRTGIRQRHIAADDEMASDLALEASRRALAAAGIGADQLSLIIVATTTPDMVFPSTACILQAKLGAARISRPSTCKRCAAVSSTRSPPRTCSFARASAVMRWWSAPKSTPASSTGPTAPPACCSETGLGRLCWRPANSRASWAPSCMPMAATPRFCRFRAKSAAAPCAALPSSRWKAMRCSSSPCACSRRSSTRSLAAHGLDKSAIDWLIPHQANLRIIEATARKLGLPMDKVIVTVDRHANTSAASIPLALGRGGARRPHPGRPTRTAGGGRRRVHLGRGTGEMELSVRP